MSDISGISGNKLRQYIDRIEHLEDQKNDIAMDIKEVFAEAKGDGFDLKIIRKIISLRKMDKNERMEQEELLSIYLNALEQPTNIQQDK